MSETQAPYVVDFLDGTQDTNKRIMRFEYDVKIKPYVRMTQRGKFVKKEALEYLASKQALGYAFANQMTHARQSAIEHEQPFGVMFVYQAPDIFRYDLDNIAKAILDAAQGVVFPDDRYCVELKAKKSRAKVFRLDLLIAR